MSKRGVWWVPVVILFSTAFCLFWLPRVRFGDAKSLHGLLFRPSGQIWRCWPATHRKNFIVRQIDFLANISKNLERWQSNFIIEPSGVVAGRPPPPPTPTTLLSLMPTTALMRRSTDSCCGAWHTAGIGGAASLSSQE
jgi:hypothetical protein